MLTVVKSVFEHLLSCACSVSSDGGQYCQGRGAVEEWRERPRGFTQDPQERELWAERPKALALLVLCPVALGWPFSSPGLRFLFCKMTGLQ